MKNLLMFIWQLPQNIIGFCISIFIKERMHISENSSGYIVKVVKWNIELTLGRYIIIGKDRGDQYSIAIKHNIYGHGKQSKIYGPLYLIIVGIPALVLYLLTVYGTLDPAQYHSLWPEDQANEFANIKNSDRVPFIMKDEGIMPL